MYEKQNPKHQKLLVDCVNKAAEGNKFEYWDTVVSQMNEKFNEQGEKEIWRGRYRRLKQEYKIKARKTTHSYKHNHNKEERLVSYLKKDCTIEYLSEMLELSRLELLGYIEELRLKGYEIQNYDSMFRIITQPLQKDNKYELYTGELTPLKFCVVSDTHLCNKKQQLTLLNLVYDECAKRGITTVFHCGDITDGMSKRPEHIYELFCLGADEQVQYVVDNYPKREGITTYFISGNHDGWHFKNGGIDVGKMISNYRPDMIYLGFQKSDITWNNCKIRLFHPQDGSSYAKSYAGQKTVEAIRGGQKPNVIFTGHHHKSVYFIDRNIHYFEVPCLCEATNFIEGKKLENTIGAIFPTITVDDLGNVITLSPETMIFYRTLDNDYKIEQKKDFKKDLIL